jgi:hypothetical protein
MKKVSMFTGLVLMLMASPLLGQANLTAIHGIPGLPQDVDVLVNGELAFSFDFPETVGPVEFDEGEYMIEIQLAGDTVFEQEVMLEDGGNYTVIAHLTYSGDPDNPGLALSTFENNVDDVARIYNSRVTLRHTANAPSVAVEVLRYWFVPAVTFPQFSNDSDGMPSSVTFEQLLGAMTVNLWAGGQQVFSTGQLQVARGTSYIAYAVGDFFDGSFQIILQAIELD